MLVRAARAAAVAVLVSWGVLALLSVAGWASAGASGPMTAALGIGSLLWSVANLGAVSDGATTISVVPLGLVVWPLIVVSRCAHTLRRDLEVDTSPRVSFLGGQRRMSAVALALFTACYVGLGLVVLLSCGNAPLRPIWWQTILGSAVVAVVGVLSGLWRTVSTAQHAPRWRDALLAAAPVSVRRGAAVGLRGAGALVVVGLVPVVASLLAHWGQVSEVQTSLHPGAVGGAVLVLLQATLAPNLAAWGLSWLAGPGFAVGSGSTFTWTRSQSVLLPNVPLLGALPDTADQSPWWALTVLLPVAVGVWTGWRALRTVSRLSAAAGKVQAVLVAALTAGLGASAVLALSGGSLGTRALLDVGPRVVESSGAVVGECLLGALLALGWSLLRFNRR